MTCEEFWNQMPELAGPGPACVEHLRGCPACSHSFNRQLALAAGLKRMAAEACRIQAPVRLEAKLLFAFRAQTGALPPRVTRRPWLPLLTWASAAAAILAVGLFTVPSIVTSRHLPPPPHHSGSRGIELAAASSEDDFIPLPNAEQIEPNEDVNVVRVEVPRSAMEAVGIAVSPEHAAERVQADVMIGADGLARAVRFVDATS